MCYASVVEAESDLAEFILVGERHGVEQQQLVIAALLNEVSKSDKKVGVIMEMISADQVKLYETFRKLSPKTPKDFGYAIGWGKTSWPDYKYYAPIFEIIWARDMALVPGDPPSAAQARWRKGAFTDADYNPARVLEQLYGQETAQSVSKSWQTSMQKAHCDQLGTEELAHVARLQMMRDGFMAQQMRAMKAAGADIVVLVAGRAHIRRDRGVPLYLGPHIDMQNIAIIETDPNEAEGETYQPKQTSVASLPYDHIILTDPLPKTENTCERLRRKGLIK